MPGSPIASFGAPNVVTDAATQTWDASQGSYFQWTLGAARTMSAITNPAPGQVIWIDVIQDSTGSRLVTWPSAFVWPGVNNSAPVLQTQAAGKDLIRAVYDATNAQWRAGLNHTRVVPAAKFTTNALTGAGTAAAGDLTGAATCYFQTTGTTPGTYTTRTATLMYADDPDAYIGKTWTILVNNTSANTLTVSGGTGVTITGTATVAQNITRTYMATFTSATALTMQIVSVGSVS